MRFPRDVSLPALAALACLSLAPLPASSAPLGARQQQSSQLLCVANIATQVTFTLDAPLVVSATLVGGGGGGSGYNGRGGGGGSTAIDFGTTHLYAAGGHGGYSASDKRNDWNGYPGETVHQTGLQLPAGVNITVTVGGGGGAGNDFCTGTKGYPCPMGGGGGGAGAYGGGGGAGKGGSDSGGAGGESAGPKKGGSHGGHGDPGVQWAGGKGENTGSKNCDQSLDKDGHNQASNCGGDGGSFFLGSQLADTAGSGGGFGSGGGSSARQYVYGNDPWDTSYYPYGGVGGSNGSNGGPARTGASNSAGYATGPDLSGKGACSFPPGLSGAVPSAAGQGGRGTDPEIGALGGVGENPGHGTVSAGNAGYATIAYASPDGVSCPVPSQTRDDGSAVDGSYCV